MVCGFRRRMGCKEADTRYGCLFPFTKKKRIGGEDVLAVVAGGIVILSLFSMAVIGKRADERIRQMWNSRKNEESFAK